MKPVITNERGKREWLYIVNKVGLEGAYQAIGELGNRKAYPLNIAKVLRLELPREEFLPELEGVTEKRVDVGKRRLADIKKLLK